MWHDRWWTVQNRLRPKQSKSSKWTVVVDDDKVVAFKTPNSFLALLHFTIVYVICCVGCCLVLKSKNLNCSNLMYCVCHMRICMANCVLFIVIFGKCVFLAPRFPLISIHHARTCIGMSVLRNINEVLSAINSGKTGKCMSIGAQHIVNIVDMKTQQIRSLIKHENAPHHCCCCCCFAYPTHKKCK